MLEMRPDCERCGADLPADVGVHTGQDDHGQVQKQGAEERVALLGLDVPLVVVGQFMPQDGRQFVVRLDELHHAREDGDAFAVRKGVELLPPGAGF